MNSFKSMQAISKALLRNNNNWKKRKRKRIWRKLSMSLIQQLEEMMKQW
jgi:hypothetical protein